MDRIVINEIDKTTAEKLNAINTTDIVYVPGFSCVSSTDRKVGPDVPTLCTSVAEFEAAFGKKPAQFAAAQAYPTTNGFPAVAIPTSGGTNVNMFAADDYDPSYIYAKELLYRGIPVLYERLNEYATSAEATTAGGTYDVTVTNFYTKVATKFNSRTGSQAVDPSCVLVNKGEYQFKYLTTGGYPSFEYNTKAITDEMATLCFDRGDAVALIDHTNNAARDLTGANSVYAAASSSTYALQKGSFAAMFTPWATYGLNAVYEGTTGLTSKSLPGSFAYLTSLAVCMNTNPNWVTVAGVIRGKVPSLTSVNTNNVLTNAIADSYQSDNGSISINAVTNITPYGQCIMGNRTLLDNSTAGGPIATSYLNIRNMASDIKKQLYMACKSLLFEQNTDVTWLNFLSMVTPLLDKMQSGNGISAYRINKSSQSTRTKIVAVVTIYPVYSVEAFDISVIISDSELSAIEE